MSRSAQYKPAPRVRSGPAAALDARANRDAGDLRIGGIDPDSRHVRADHPVPARHSGATATTGMSHRRISRWGRNQRLSRSATGVPERERPCRFRAADYCRIGVGQRAHNKRPGRHRLSCWSRLGPAGQDAADFRWRVSGVTHQELTAVGAGTSRDPAPIYGGSGGVGCRSLSVRHGLAWTR